MEEDEPVLFESFEDLIQSMGVAPEKREIVPVKLPLRNDALLSKCQALRAYAGLMLQGETMRDFAAVTATAAASLIAEECAQTNDPDRCAADITAIFDSVFDEVLKKILKQQVDFRRQP